MAKTSSCSLAVPQDDPCSLFETAYYTFSNALPDGVQKEFAGLKTPSEMFTRFGQLIKDTKSCSNRTHRFMKGPARIGERLSPYFEVVNIYVQSNPEYAALIWGSLRFIFLVAKNYTMFLTKVENLLLRMVNTLPNFETFLKEVRERKAIVPDGVIPGLIQALARIYNDILEFCHRLCTILQPQQKGFRSKMRLFGAMSFKPFDAHFADIVENFEIHSKFFDDLRGNTSAVLALQFYERWEAGITKTHAALCQIHDKQNEKAREEAELRRSAAVSELQRRLGSPAWATTFEHARSHRIEETGEWLLDHPLMLEQLETGDQKPTNVLVMYGKPGYGKTTLATTVIDHIRDMASTIKPGTSHSLAFFFFDRQSRHRSSHDAWRALLAQLVFSRQFDQIVLDIAALARPAHDTGQQLASDDEVFSILHLFLLQFSGCTLVCDGIDECTNRDDFLVKLGRLATDHTSCNFLIFSRPTITIPKDLQKRSKILQMDNAQNLPDITSFVHPQIEALIDDGDLVLPENTSIDDIVASICNRSNGMFLWATLLLAYLKLPSLSLAQRLDVIQDSSRFEGLRSLYETILTYINQEYPRLSRRNIRRAISWVIGAFRPLTVTELQVAIAQMPDKPIDDSDFIPNFKNCIGPMTGALIEITKDKTVRLIHITVADYLINTSENMDPDFTDETILDFKGVVVQHYITKTCLAYMLHTIPIGPYSDRYTSGENFSSTCKEHPLIDYTSRYWTAHLREATIRFGDYPSSCFSHLEDLSQKALTFLSDKLKFTSWTEALWHMHCPPEAWSMNSITGSDITPTSPGSIVQPVVSLLLMAYEEYIQLEKDWGDVLSKYPEELWLPSISAFSKSQLRKVSIAADTTSIFGDMANRNDEIILETKCSPSGHAIGILKAKYKTGTSNYIYRSDAPTGFSPILIKYELRSLSDDTTIFMTHMDMPAEDIRIIDADSDHGTKLFQQKNDSFSIESSISPTLMEVMVGCTLLKLAVECTAQGPEFKCTKHTLHLLRDKSGFARSNSAKSFWKLLLSPGAEYLLLLRNSGSQDSRIQSTSFAVDIFQDPNCRRSPLKPKFTWVAWKTLSLTKGTKEKSYETLDEFILHYGNAERFNPRSELQALDSFDDDTPPPGPSESEESVAIEKPILHFHPSLPQVVYSYGKGTFVWNFCSLLHSTIHKINQEHTRIYKSALRNIRIADSGNLLYGFEQFIDGTKKVAILNLSKHQKVFGTQKIKSTRSRSFNDTQSIVQHLQEFSQTDLLREASTQAQPSDTAMLVMQSPNKPALSILRRSQEDDSLVQELFDAQGSSSMRTLLHLPKSLSTDVDVMLLRPGEITTSGAPQMKVLLGVQPKDSYSFKNDKSGSEEHPNLPIIYRRDKRSITAVEGEGTKRLKGDTLYFTTSSPELED